MRLKQTISPIGQMSQGVISDYPTQLYTSAACHKKQLSQIKA